VVLARFERIVNNREYRRTLMQATIERTGAAAIERCCGLTPRVVPTRPSRSTDPFRI
jgi:hypothetical protein